MNAFITDHFSLTDFSHCHCRTVPAVSLVANSKRAGLQLVLHPLQSRSVARGAPHTSACPKTGGLPATHAPTARAGLFPHIVRDFARSSAGGDVSRCQTRSADLVAFTSCRSVDAEYWR